MKENSKKKSGQRFWLVLSAVVLLLIGVRIFVVDWIWIDGESMLPTLKDGELVLAIKLSKTTLQTGDIAIVRYPNGKQCVKRVIGVAGDTIEIRDNHLILNGDIMDESYVYESQQENMEKITVPEATIFVMGDNRNYSTDSRNPEIGPIQSEDIVGRVVAVIYPFNHMRNESELYA